MVVTGTAAGPVYLAEVAPAKLRGTLAVMFQGFVTIGIFIASLINYGELLPPLLQRPSLYSHMIIFTPTVGRPAAIQMLLPGTQFIRPWGWRLSLALAGTPGILIICASIVLPESPSSLAERGHLEHAFKVRSSPFSAAVMETLADLNLLEFGLFVDCRC